MSNGEFGFDESGIHRSLRLRQDNLLRQQHTAIELFFASSTILALNVLCNEGFQDTSTIQRVAEISMVIAGRIVGLTQREFARAHSESPAITED